MLPVLQRLGDAYGFYVIIVVTLLTAISAKILLEKIVFIHDLQ